MAVEVAKYLTPKSMFSYSAINYMQAGLGFLITLLLARYLTKEDYGYYTYGLVFVNMITMLGSFGLDRSLVRDLVQNQEGQREYMVGATLFKSIFGTLVFLGILIWAFFFQGNDHAKLAVVGLSALTGLLFALSSQAWYDTTGRIHRHAILTLVERIIYFLLVLGLVFSAKGLQVVVLSFAAMMTLKFIFITIEWSYIKKEFQGVVIRAKLIFLKIIQHNKWIWFAVIGNLMMGQINQLILEEESGLEQLAAFGLAYQFIHVIRILQGQFLRLAKPKIAADSSQFADRNLLKALLKSCGMILILSLLLVAPFYFVVPYIMNVVIGENFLDAIPVFNILLLWVLIYGIGVINNQYLISLHLQRHYFVTSLLFGALSIFLGYYFIGSYGAIGTALAILIAHSCSIITQFIIVIVYLKNNNVSPRHST